MMKITKNSTEKATQKKKKHHHYLPEFYLKRFIDPNNKPYVWVYEKGGRRIRKASANDIAVQKHYYSFTTVEGERDTCSFENLFAKTEEHTAPIFAKIEAQQDLTDEDRSWFATFLAFTLTRVPNYRENVERLIGETIREILISSAVDPKRFESMVRRFEEKTEVKIGIPLKDYRKLILDGQYEVIPSAAISLELVLLAEKLVPIFWNMKWIFIRATPDYKFVTSDNPLSRYDPEPSPPPFNGVALASKTVQVTFPISRELALLASWKGREGHIRGHNSQIKEITRRTIMSASRFVFSSVKSDTLDRLVQKFKYTAPKLVVS
jgi:hypothetical protein